MEARIPLPENKGRVLVVDDHENIRFFFCEMLKRAGFETEMAQDVDAAQQLLQHQAVDVVLTDIVMPGTNGMEFLKIVKDTLPDTQVIVVTGYPDVDTASEAVRSGAYDYLIKPVTKQDLVHVTNKAFEAKKLKEEKQRLEKENHIYRKNLEKIIQRRTNSLIESQKRYHSFLSRNLFFFLGFSGLESSGVTSGVISSFL